MKLVFLGLSITSSWGNGHATTYRSLISALAARGHDILFLERDQPWYADNRDLAKPAFCRVALYHRVSDLKRYRQQIRDADCVIVGSYVPDGAAVSEWIVRTAQGATAFYDIDTPVTLRKLKAGERDYLSPELIPDFDLYLSFTGGPTLERLSTEYHARSPHAFYCSVDPDSYYPEKCRHRWDLGYCGTYSIDRQPTLDRLLLAPARSLPESHFVVAGPQYPAELDWSKNIERIEHLSPVRHREFYNAQRFTLNVTRRDMVSAGWSPSVRLFEAAACGVPMISDHWEGLETFFRPDDEILIARSSEEVRGFLQELTSSKAAMIAQKARKRVLAEHTSEHRARQLETLLGEFRPTSLDPKKPARSHQLSTY